jgi:hypothetical protein
MPLGKSGKYYMNPHDMTRKGDAPDNASGSDHMPLKKEDAPGDKGGQGAEGDGNHHHELHEVGDSTYHSVHTHPDGHQEEADHGSYQEATDHQDALMDPEHGAEQDQSQVNDEESEPEDMAGMYARHGE